MKSKSTIQESLAEFAIMFLIGVLSLGLLAYVGNREAATKYPKFEIEKVISQTRPIQLILDKFLNAGLPLAQFAGFDTLVAPIVKVDDAIDGVTVIGRLGLVVFQQTTPGVVLDPIENIDRGLSEIKVQTGANQTLIFVPLRSRFGLGGQIVIHVPKTYVSDKVDKATGLLPWAAGLGALILGVYGAFALGMSPKRRAKYDRLVFAVVFLSVSATVVFGLTKLYAAGSQAKAEGFALALSERLRSIYDLGLSMEDIDGVDTTLISYRTLNPEISSIAFIIDGQVAISTNPRSVGLPFTPDKAAFGVEKAIEGVPNLNARIYVSLPYDVVLAEVGRTAKTFVVLLVASGFMAGLFFQLGGALRRLKDAKRNNATDGQSALEAIKPVLFVGFLIENLAASFMPQLMQKSAAAGGLPPSLASIMFMAYFLTFAATLVPAGVYAGRNGARPMIALGAALAAAASIMMALSDNYVSVVAARMLSGVGQGMLFIGSQSFILAYAAADKRTQSAGIIVYTFNGGMLSGLVIGGLLANYIAWSGVFWIAATAAVAILLYTLALIEPSPPAPRVREVLPTDARGSILEVFRNPGFVLTTALVGIPAKAVLTGVIFFAMPLLLSGLKLEQEDIGQIIMFYALGVLLSSHFVSRYADQGGNVGKILFLGLVISGIGLCVIGAIGFASVEALNLGPIPLTLILLTGTFTVGLGHGAINAPVVTYIASTDASKKLGEAPVTAFYRFIERGGHIAGPVLVGQLFLLSDQSPAAIAWLGAATVGFALLFVMTRQTQRARSR